MNLFRKLLLATAVSAAALLPGLATAQAFPTKPLKIVVPFAAGGSADAMARILAQGMSAQLGQPITVENRGGAGGIIGIDAVAKAAPDGYTLGLGNATGMSAAQFMTDKMPFDSDKDLALLTLVVRVPEVLVANSKLGFNTAANLVSYAKANPAKLNYGSAGASSIIRLAVELFKVEAGVDIVHVPYKGIGPAVVDLLAGQVQVTIADVPAVLQHIRSGALKPLAITSAKRVPMLPDVPTTAEIGYPKVLSDNWYGLIAPSGTPPEVQKRLHAAAVAALQDPQIAQQFLAQGALPAPGSPEDFRATHRDEKAKWLPIVKANNIKLD
jgi:tripartite-type tricarboxylate transporter receptor subunit TctC